MSRLGAMLSLGILFAAAPAAVEAQSRRAGSARAQREEDLEREVQRLRELIAQYREQPELLETRLREYVAEDSERAQRVLARAQDLLESAAGGDKAVLQAVVGGLTGASKPPEPEAEGPGEDGVAGRKVKAGGPVGPAPPGSMRVIGETDQEYVKGLPREFSSGHRVRADDMPDLPPPPERPDAPPRTPAAAASASPADRAIPRGSAASEVVGAADRPLYNKGALREIHQPMGPQPPAPEETPAPPPEDPGFLEWLRAAWRGRG